MKKRMTREVAKSIVGRNGSAWRHSAHGRAWPHVTDRDALIDAAVMDQIRAAYSADSVHLFTADEIMEFRAMLVEELALWGYAS